MEEKDEITLRRKEIEFEEISSSTTFRTNSE